MGNSHLVIFFMKAMLAYCTAENRDQQFTITKNRTVKSSHNTTDVYSKSPPMCAIMCALQDTCCVASFSPTTSTCRLDTTDNCCVATYVDVGWSTVRRIQTSRIDNFSFGASLYKIVDEHVNWTTAKDNCTCLGGKLVEIETVAENEFIKNELRTLDLSGSGYWFGSYNFNNDMDMEWISHPDQVMPFSDMYPGQPNGINDQLCMCNWKPWDFRWGDYYCDQLLAYICEFE